MFGKTPGLGVTCSTKIMVTMQNMIEWQNWGKPFFSRKRLSKHLKERFLREDYYLEIKSYTPR